MEVFLELIPLFRSTFLPFPLSFTLKHSLDLPLNHSLPLDHSPFQFHISLSPQKKPVVQKRRYPLHHRGPLFFWQEANPVGEWVVSSENHSGISWSGLHSPRTVYNPSDYLVSRCPLFSLNECNCIWCIWVLKVVEFRVFGKWVCVNSLCFYGY